jgi:hypothetical protein
MNELNYVVALLQHLHDMMHAQGAAVAAQGIVIAGIAKAVKEFSPATIDPELAAAIVEHQKHIDALKAALDAQMPQPK